MDRRAHARIVARGLAAYPRVEIRIVAFLWELAESCGVAVADEQVVVPVPLTHRVLAAVVGCERSSVAAALGALRRENLVVRTRAGWMLRGSLPQQVEFLLRQAPRQRFALVGSGAERAGLPGFRTTSAG
ncbi:MAG TPA: helix-turn-helix domain-containing protein [Thermoleophilaceae bacterium]